MAKKDSISEAFNQLAFACDIAGVPYPSVTLNWRTYEKLVRDVDPLNKKSYDSIYGIKITVINDVYK